MIIAMLFHKAFGSSVVLLTAVVHSIVYVVSKQRKETFCFAFFLRDACMDI